MKADLHIHSRCSDGSDAPDEIVRKARRLGIGCIALTDHDTVSGVAAARAAGEREKVQVVSGVELSTYSIAEIHVLGYGIDENDAQLVEKLDRIASLRRERINAILDKLAAIGIVVDGDKLDEVEGSVGRPHVAKLLIDKGYATTIAEAFDKYLGEKGSAYVPSKRMTPADGVRLIKSAGGVPVLAHPMLIKQKGRLADLVAGLVGIGLGGIETYYPSHTEADVRALKEVARRYNLITTGGSDYHGEGKQGDVGCADWSVDAKSAAALGIKLR